jgi:hypothetical protein
MECYDKKFQLLHQQTLAVNEKIQNVLSTGSFPMFISVMNLFD